MTATRGTFRARAGVRRRGWISLSVFAVMLSGTAISFLLAAFHRLPYVLAAGLTLTLLVLGFGLLTALDSGDPLQHAGRYILAVQWIVPVLAWTLVSALVETRVPAGSGGKMAFYEVAANVIPLLLVVAVLQEGGIDLREGPRAPGPWRRGLHVLLRPRTSHAQPQERRRWEKAVTQAGIHTYRVLPALLVMLILGVGEARALAVVAVGRGSKDALLAVSGALSVGLVAAIVRILAAPWDRPQRGQGASSDESASWGARPRHTRIERAARNSRRRAARLQRSRNIR